MSGFEDSGSAGDASGFSALTASAVSAPDADPKSELQRVRRELDRLHAALRELGTPVLPIYDGVLVMPLIGHLDAARGAHLMDDLLQAIAAHQAVLIIIDITGVSLVDTAVANMLMQATRAAGLLGSQCVFAGVTAAVSRTIVQLGIDLGRVPSCRNLQDAIRYALKAQGYAIVRQRPEVDWLAELAPGAADDPAKS